ncbi:Hsp20/alpha crystallin family protein [Salinarimonas rosea]|uniref:Hsp20/alpha crystallin family protein n=1 Tax=Salinarimonas rosea TaxID=552063 RepID=UPI0003FE0BA3|nr:Hsp20/alpha crystallin family protein [Salinarimonas rosea]
MSSLSTLRHDERDPFTALRNDIEHLVRRLGGDMPALLGERRFPALDVTEGANEIEITAELPGVAREDVTVEAADGALVIRGEKKSAREDETKTDGAAAHVLERSYGSFLRRVALPFAVDPETIEASFQDGVLTVRVPRPARAAHAPRSIPIRQG